MPQYRHSRTPACAPPNRCVEVMRHRKRQRFSCLPQLRLTRHVKRHTAGLSASTHEQSSFAPRSEGRLSTFPGTPLRPSRPESRRRGDLCLGALDARPNRDQLSCAILPVRNFSCESSVPQQRHTSFSANFLTVSKCASGEAENLREKKTDCGSASLEANMKQDFLSEVLT